jgi:hypothetical protein
MKRSFLLTITGLICTTLPVSSETLPVQNATKDLGRTGHHDPGSFNPVYYAEKKALASSWSSSRPCIGGPPGIRFLVGDDGKVYDPEMMRYSGDDQYDAECLEAICGLSPIAKADTDINTTARIEHFFEEFPVKEGLQPSYDGSDVNEYLRTHPQPAAKHDAFVVVHRIPLSVLDRYPGMFTKEELQSQSNLMEIPVGYGDNRPDKQGIRVVVPHYVIGIANLYAFWGQLFKNPHVTKDEIRQWAKRAHRHTS